MDFGNALNALRAGHKVTRCGWPTEFWVKIEQVGEEKHEVIVRHTRFGVEDWIDIDPDNLLTTDWEIVD